MVVETFLAFLSKIFCFTSFVAGKNSFPQPLSASEEKRCVELVKEGDLAAREKLIRHNLRLVAHVVKKYHSAGEADDLISVGSIGLIKGIASLRRIAQSVSITKFLCTYVPTKSTKPQ